MTPAGAEQQEPETLYLIDGYAQFFRAYHAIRTPMSSPVTKEPTNLTFGFSAMLLKLLRGEGSAFGGRRPDYIAVALDVSGDRGTFRSELYPQYKATRPPPPEDLPVQVERVLKMLREVGVPLLGVEGFEADDVIATVARQLRSSGVRVRVISKDKDLKQLLRRDEFELYDIHTDELITEADLLEATGLKPEQVVDMLALMGDTVDNVPGVPGIGPKTAAKLIAQHGSLDALLAAADRVKGKRGEDLRATAPRLGLSRDLVRLRDEAETGFELEQARVSGFALDRLGPCFAELGFRNRLPEELEQLLGRPAAAPQPRRRADGPGGGPGGLFAHLASGDDGSGDGASEGSPAPGAGRAVRIRRSYRVARTAEDIRELVGEASGAGVVAVDTETDSVRPTRATLVGLSFSTAPGTGWYVPVRSPEQDRHLGWDAVRPLLQPMLEDPAIAKIGHNLKYDLIVLERHGVRLDGHDHADGGDSMVESYLLDASRSSHAMDALALGVLNHACVPITDLIGRGKKQIGFHEVPLEQASEYAAEDADVTLRLHNAFAAQLESQNQVSLYREVEMPLVSVLARLEQNGVLVDPAELDRQRERLQARLEQIVELITEAAEESLGRTFDVNSPKQLSAALFNHPDAEPAGLGIKPVKKTKTGYSTDAEVLEKLAQDPAVESEIPTLVLEHRQLSKLVSTYLQNLKDDIHPDTARIHASFNQTVTVTGRLSSSDPNLQNIPIRTDLGREIRRAFVAPKGRVLVSADYSQIELRLLAHLSGDEALIKAFLAGEDIHTAVAAEVYRVPLEKVTREQRSGAKMVNFGIVYGITPFGLARRLGVEQGVAADIISGYKQRFARIGEFLDECVAKAEQSGYAETMLGRRRPIPEMQSTNPARRSFGVRTAINSVVQGSAADLIKIAMVRLHRLIENAEPGTTLRGTKMLLQIHDELVFECDEQRADEVRRIVTREMEGSMDLRVPLVVDASWGRNWYEGKS